MNYSAQRPTIREVAAEAGVSKSLVSLVFSSPESVSAIRKERVLKASEKLGYAPNFLARSLAADSGTFIAILVADLHNPLFAQIADQIRIRIEKEGKSYFITSAMIRDEKGVPFLDKQTLKSIIDLHPESLLVIGSIPRIDLLENLPKNLSIIIASGVPTRISRASIIRTNEDIGMRLVVDHLVGLGHQNILHLAGSRPGVAKDRINGYEKAMNENGLKAYSRIIKSNSDEENSGYESTLGLIKGANPPTAIACFNDLHAIGAQAAMIEAGFELSIVGYDNTFLSGLNQISLTTVDPGNREIADKCADLLLQNHIAQNEKYFATPHLVVRSSTKGVSI